ncbi:enoyl-CoA hydratase/isomerase family protein [Lentzea tibetensis]|uniref:Enoyl-CoA hydratase/isomerase family protein n=1 Tax=Lentzea tibetensis TaxID=2591470 RepID=A0A563F2M5_9PSEU|nr:enoyl-CoA hydratase/isomerase family protein [Lentzea tibetensis]TWP54169.1 enoyl-CoA hydratase/isomerase family protein [Lentzea tibetensis]
MTVVIERRGKVAVLTLSREHRLNALSLQLEQDLLDVLSTSDVTSSRAVVFTGAGRAFSTGADVDEVRGLDAAAIAEYYRASGRVYEAVAGLPQPTVSAVHGWCLGGGFELALATDLRVADDTAVFGLPEVGLGIVPSSGGLTRLVRMFGTARARELVLLGTRVPASDALRLGLVTEVTSVGNDVARAVELAAKLSAQPALAVAVAKQAIDAVAESSAAASLLIERLAYGMLNRVDDERPE